MWVTESDMLRCQQKQSERNNELEKNLATLTEWHKNMTKEIKEFKSETKEWFKNLNSKLDNWMNKFESNFVTKQEHKQVTEKVETINKIIWFILTWFWAWIIWAILKLII